MSNMNKQEQNLLEMFNYTPMQLLIRLKELYLGFNWPSQEFEITIFVEDDLSMPSQNRAHRLRFTAEGVSGKVKEVSIYDRWTWTGDGKPAECLNPDRFIELLTNHIHADGTPTLDQLMEKL